MSAQLNFLLASWTGSTKFVTFFGGVSSSSRSLTSCMNKWMNEYRQLNRYTSCQAMQTRRPDPSPFSPLDTCTVIVEFDLVHLSQVPSTHSFSHPIVKASVLLPAGSTQVLIHFFFPLPAPLPNLRCVWWRPD